jgi:hypothetical protein
VRPRNPVLRYSIGFYLTHLFKMSMGAIKYSALLRVKRQLQSQYDAVLIVNSSGQFTATMLASRYNAIQADQTK